MSIVDPNGVMILKQEGYYYSATGNDALILNKYLGYNLYGVNTFKTGVPINVVDSVLKKIDVLGMDYDILDKNKNRIVSKRFHSNGYEVFEPSEYPEKPIRSSKSKSKKLQKKMILQTYIHVLEGLSEGCNYFTGETIADLDVELKGYCFEMAMFFSEKLKAREKNDLANPNHGQIWTEEESAEVLAEYKQGVSIEEISKKFGRSKGSIRSRLIKEMIVEENNKEK